MDLKNKEQTQNTISNMSTLVTYDQFNTTHLGGSDPQIQSIKKNNETINYNEIKLHYNYNTPEEPVVSDLYLELPPMQATGIRSKTEPAMGKNGAYNKESHSMMLTFNLADPQLRAENQKALEKIDEVHAVACQILGSCRGKVKMHDFDPTRPGGMFKNPIYWPRDEVTGEKIKGRNPSLWVKLHNYKNNRTLFTDLNRETIDWKLLSDVDITFVPLLHIEKIYIGSKATLQIYLASAVVIKIVQLGTETRQKETAERIKEKFGSNLADTVAAQLAELRMARQDQLAKSSISSSTHNNNDYGSKEAESDYGSMNPMNTAQTVIHENSHMSNFTQSTPAVTTQTSLTDFLNPQNLQNNQTVPQINPMPSLQGSSQNPVAPRLNIAGTGMRIN
jgi:hypothetical protein